MPLPKIVPSKGQGRFGFSRDKPVLLEIADVVARGCRRVSGMGFRAILVTVDRYGCVRDSWRGVQFAWVDEGKEFDALSR